MKVNRVLTLRPELLKMNVSDADVPEQRVLVQEPEPKELDFKPGEALQRAWTALPKGETE